MNKKLISAGLGALILSFQLGTAAQAHQGGSDEMVSGLMRLDHLVASDNMTAVQALLHANPELAALVQDVIPQSVKISDRRALRRESLRDYGVRLSKRDERKDKKRKDKRDDDRQRKDRDDSDRRKDHDDDDHHDDDHQY